MPAEQENHGCEFLVQEQGEKGKHQGVLTLSGRQCHLDVK